MYSDTGAPLHDERVTTVRKKPNLHPELYQRMRTPDRVLHVTFRVLLTAETKDPINEGLLMAMPKDATLINTARPESARGQRRSRFSVGEQTSVTSPMRHARVPRKSRRSPALEALVHASPEQRVYHRERSCGRASSIEKKLTVPAEARSDGEDRNRRSTVHDSRTHLLEPRTHREPDQDPSPSARTCAMLSLTGTWMTRRSQP